MGKPSAPKPTDPRETSAASTGTNVSTAIANNIMGNVNTYGPDGSTQFTQSGDYNWTDPYTGKEYTVPKFDQTTTLTPEGQKVFDQTQGTKLNLATLANNQSGFLNDYMATPFSYDSNDHEKWALGLYDKLTADKNRQALSSEKMDLANSGIMRGSDAWNRSMETAQEAQMNARDRFLLDSQSQGFGQAQATRNQPINEITALMSGSQVSQPQTPGFQASRIPTTDNAGIISNYDNQRMQQWQAEMAQRNSLMGGLFSLGSSMIGLSDKRAKKNIKKVGRKRVKGTDKSTTVYDYNYKGEPKGTPKHRGVMAQNLKKTKPSAVKQTRSGLFAVDYSKV